MVTHSNPPDGAPRLRALPPPPDTLPAQPTPLVGRDDEVAALRARLRDPTVRLLTLTGPPGTGKTRLALATAERCLDAFPDGVWFVALESVREPDAVIAAVAHTLGLRDAGEQSLAEALAAHLKDRQVLLLLDNFEQVLPAAEQVAELLGGNAGLKVLVTSRTRLRLRWEHEFPVAPLALPDAARLTDVTALGRSPAVELFRQRAAAAQPGFDLSLANAADVARVCAALDGLPLAIELAAARVRLLPPRAILQRLEGGLALLTGGPRDMPDRHRTLRAAIAWSYDLLSAEEQALLRQLGVFVGGCSLEAAEAVAEGVVDGEAGATALDLLFTLADQSLLRRDSEPSGEPRLRMLETIREFALEQLTATGELADTQRRHSVFFLALAEAAEPQLRGSEQPLWLGRLEAEHDNIRAALARALEQGESETALRLAWAMARFWQMHGYLSEGRRWLEQALVADSVAPLRWRALALQAVAGLAWSQADYPAARAFAEESLALHKELGEKREIAVSLNLLGTIAVRQADYVTGRGRFAEALALVRELGDTWRTTVALHNLGIVALNEGDYATARSLFEECLGLRRGLGDQTGIALSLDALGELANAEGDHAAARALCEESLALRRELGDARATAYSLGNLAVAARAQGDHGAARALIEESLALRRELGDRHGIARSLSSLAGVAQDQGDDATANSCWKQGLALSRELGYTQGIADCLNGVARLATTRAQPARATRLLAAATALRETVGLVIPPSERAEHEAGVAAVRAALDEEAFAAAWYEGRAMSLDEAVADALRLSDEREAMSDESSDGPANSSLIASRSSLPGGLTAREAEVLALIASGQTNREIAQALVLSVATVERHIANLYAKIDARGRADATAFALRHGLV